MTDTASSSFIAACVNYADKLHRLFLQGDPSGEVARVAAAINEEEESEETP